MRLIITPLDDGVVTIPVQGRNCHKTFIFQGLKYGIIKVEKKRFPRDWIMAESTQEKPVTQQMQSSNATADMAADNALPPAPDLSWGEKYKAQTYHFVRDILINYIINFTLAASFTYAFDLKLAKWYKEKVTDRLNPKQSEVRQFVIEFMTKTQLLLCGGHVLQPFLKWMKDNRKRLEFRIGHVLDLAQEMLGRGNTASKRSIEEYNRVSELVSVGDMNRKQRDAVPVTLSDEDKALLEKHHVNEQLQFTDKRQSWGRVIKARLTGVLCTTLLSIGLALTKTQPKAGEKPPIYDFRNRWEKPWGEWLGNNVISRIPLVRKIFDNPQPLFSRPGTTGHQLIGEYFIDDAIYTAASKLGFDNMEKYFDKKEAEAEKAEKLAEKAEIREEKIEDAIEVPPPVARRKILEGGEKSFIARRQDEMQNLAPAMAAP